MLIIHIDQSINLSPYFGLMLMNSGGGSPVSFGSCMLMEIYRVSHIYLKDFRRSLWGPCDFINQRSASTGGFISIRAVGVASTPVEPRPLYFAGFLTCGKRKLVENLQLIGALLWKLQFKINKKRSEAVARSCWILQKICFITFKSYISKQFLFWYSSN